MDQGLVQNIWINEVDSISKFPKSIGQVFGHAMGRKGGKPRPLQVCIDSSPPEVLDNGQLEPARHIFKILVKRIDPDYEGNTYSYQWTQLDN